MFYGHIDILLKGAGFMNEHRGYGNDSFCFLKKCPLGFSLHVSQILQDLHELTNHMRCQFCSVMRTSSKYFTADEVKLECFCEAINSIGSSEKYLGTCTQCT